MIKEVAEILLGSNSETYFVEIFDQICLKRCIIFILSPEFLDLFRYK